MRQLASHPIQQAVDRCAFRPQLARQHRFGQPDAGGQRMALVFSLPQPANQLLGNPETGAGISERLQQRFQHSFLQHRDERAATRHRQPKILLGQEQPVGGPVESQRAGECHAVRVHVRRFRKYEFGGQRPQRPARRTLAHQQHREHRVLDPLAWKRRVVSVGDRDPRVRMLALERESGCIRDQRRIARLALQDRPQGGNRSGPAGANLEVDVPGRQGAVQAERRLPGGGNRQSPQPVHLFQVEARARMVEHVRVDSRLGQKA